ncbi:MAG: hypothetical protein ACLRWQ_21330 [Flavonifractor plautii]
MSEMVRSALGPGTRINYVGRHRGALRAGDAGPVLSGDGALSGSG